MPYELGRALLLSEAVTPAALARALFIVATEGAPLPRVLVAFNFITPEKLEEELARAEAPSVQNVVPVQELVDALPPGLCSRLLALPIRIDAFTGTVDVAVADARDPHAPQEIGFFLKAPIRIVRAPLAALERALDRSTAPHALAARNLTSLGRSGPQAGLGETPRSIYKTHRVQRTVKETPAWGTPVPRSSPSQSGVHRSFGGMHEAQESDLPPVLQTGRKPRPTLQDLPPAPAPPPPRRSRPSSPVLAHALLSNEPVDARVSSAPLLSARADSWVPPPPALPFPEPSRVLAAMRNALDRDEVLHALLTGVRVVARKVALFVVKRDAFIGWRCTPEFGEEADLRKIRISNTLPSALSNAAASGRYLGPIYNNEAHAPLLQVMGKSTRDVAITAVRLKGQSTMLVLADELGDTALGTKRIDELARAAGDALTRILKRAR
ncbi:hypothetical protein LZC95_10620 [Pendulispora brunnea]|uniref:Type II secretion system protein GspE N-terminal domain-containing protein n=1 Tax=Pendulispora brunnea TaxID=2905690 RepID=A0ABZ2KF18_9BACT